MTRLCMTIILIASLSGCATTAAVTQVQNRVAQIEMEIGQNNDDIRNLTTEIRTLGEDIETYDYADRAYPSSGVAPVPIPSQKDDSVFDENDQQFLYTMGGTFESSAPKQAAVSVNRSTDVIRVDVTASTLQVALKNAGFYAGAVDGKIGLQSKKAIREFQDANGLKADGIVGPKTWGILKIYLK